MNEMCIYDIFCLMNIGFKVRIYKYFLVEYCKLFLNM